MQTNQFTHDDFKAMKKALGLNNKLISEIIGTSEQNVKMQTTPSKPLSTWAKAMIYVFQNPAVDLELKK